MKAQVPAYLIKYISCQQPEHEGQKINLICLANSCQQHALICSLCAASTHRNHSYKPLKIYLDELYRRYKLGGSSYAHEIDELQRRKIILLLNLKNSVQKIAEEFMRLEEDIIVAYEKIKAQIYQNEARRSKFEQFYLSMIKDNYGDPKFEIKNYLYREQVQNLTEKDIFQDLTHLVSKEIKGLRHQFMSDETEPLDKSLPVIPVEHNKSYLLPANITNNAELFTQTAVGNNHPNLGLFDVEIGLWTAKVRVVVESLPVGGKITFGLIRKQEFLKANFQFKDTLNCLYLDSTGKHKGAQYSHIPNIQAHSVIDFFLKKQNLRVNCKNNTALFNLNDKKYCFFFAIEGNCQIRLTYPYTK